VVFGPADTLRRDVRIGERRPWNTTTATASANHRSTTQAITPACPRFGASPVSEPRAGLYAKSVQFPVVDVSGWTRGEPEPGGDEAKLWLSAPDDFPLGGRWLLKPRKLKVEKVSKARLQAGESHGVLVGGQDWAEKIAYELADLLEIPAVTTELAVLTDTQGTMRGSMSRDMRP
jgi:hypothetical protein